MADAPAAPEGHPGRTERPAAGAARVLVLLNPRAGSGGGEQRARDALSRAGLAAEIRRPRPGALTDAARTAAAAGARVVVAAGGDGTVSAVAGGLAGTSTALGVLPLGTFNHFARDLRIPADLPGAARVIATGEVRQVDVGRLGDRVFVNNASIGIYPLAVEARGARSRLPRRWAMGLALLRQVVHLPMVRLRLRFAGTAVPRRTPLLFVGNNAYEMRLLAPQFRPALDAGVLSVVIVRRTSRRRLVLLALRALAGRVVATRDLETLRVEELRVETRHPRRLLVAADGELFRVEAPIEFRTWPRALRVLAPGGARP